MNLTLRFIEKERKEKKKMKIKWHDHLFGCNMKDMERRKLWVSSVSVSTFQLLSNEKIKEKMGSYVKIPMMSLISFSFNFKHPLFERRVRIIIVMFTVNFFLFLLANQTIKE